MGSIKPLTKIEIAAAVVSFGLIFLLGVARQAAVRSGVSPKSADIATRFGLLLLFLIFGLSCMGLMLHVFVALQVRTGNGAAPMIRFLDEHETGLALGLWGFLLLGFLVALPVMLRDMMGLPVPIGRSQGTLVADIGMSIDEVKRRSTLKFPEPRLMGDGSRLGVKELVFDYHIGDSAVHFPDSRYYWLQTGTGDTTISSLNIGVSPRKMPVEEFKAFQRKTQQELLADGWMPGHYLARSEETVQLWAGKRTAGDGRYWKKGKTLVILEANQIDKDYILYLNLRPADHDRELVFEPSAWIP